jgi:uncharacterized protein YdeI (YjbR/CyaY-like superfamily)
MPVWFRKALRAEPRALARWKALTPRRQKEILRYLMNVMTAPARTRVVERTVGMLAGEGGRHGTRE